MDPLLLSLQHESPGNCQLPLEAIRSSSHRVSSHLSSISDQPSSEPTTCTSVADLVLATNNVGWRPWPPSWEGSLAPLPQPAQARLSTREARHARAHWDEGASAREARAGAMARHLQPSVPVTREMRNAIPEENLSVSSAETSSSAPSFFTLMVQGFEDAYQDDAARRIQVGCRRRIRTLMFRKHYMIAFTVSGGSLPPEMLAAVAVFCV